MIRKAAGSVLILLSLTLLFPILGRTIPDGFVGDLIAVGITVGHLSWVAGLWLIAAAPFIPLLAWAIPLTALALVVERVEPTALRQTLIVAEVLAAAAFVLPSRFPAWWCTRIDRLLNVSH